MREPIRKPPIGKTYKKITELKGYHISGDNECWCLAKEVDRYGIALSHKWDESDLIYPSNLFPDETKDHSSDTQRKWNIKVTVECEEVK